MNRILLGAVAALALSGSAALADDASAPATATPAAATIGTICHHDGEMIQTANGPVVCHLKHPTGVKNMSREWFRDQQLRSATMNH